MRPWWLVLALVVSVQAADYGGEDALGDVTYRDPNLGDFPAPRDHSSIDIVEVVIHGETETTFLLKVVVAGVDALEQSPRLSAGFRFDGLEYRIWQDGCQSQETQPALSKSAGLGGSTQVACLEGGWRDATTFEVVIPKDAVRDRTSLPVGVGRTIEGLFADTRDIVAATVTPGPSFSAITAFDRAPDEGRFEGMFSMLLGAHADADLVLETPARLRASNGGPDTIVFPVSLRNLGSGDAVVLLEANDLPQQWEVRAPGRVEVPAGEARQVPVVVSTGGAHSHGETLTFTLEATTPAGELATLELGIHYLDIPQLAGHHPQLFFHSIRTEQNELPPPLGAPQYMPWFNTLREQAGADEGPFVSDSYIDDDRQDQEYYGRWHIPLDPALLIGMDFAPERSGDLEVGFVSERSIGAFDVSARLMHCHAQDPSGEEPGRHDCATGSWFELGRTDAATFDANPDRSWLWETELVITEYADLVPYVDGSNIALWIDGHMTASILPRVDPKESSMRLPLLEYKDPIDATFEDLTSLRITPLDVFEKKANAGQTVWFRFDVENTGASRHITTSTFGHNADWSAAIPPERSLGAGEAGQVVVRVDIPNEAFDGDFAEVLLLVEDAKEPAITAVSKFRVSVVDTPVPAEVTPDIDAANKDSPAPLPFVVFGALLIIAAGRRRQAT